MSSKRIRLYRGQRCTLIHRVNSERSLVRFDSGRKLVVVSADLRAHDDGDSFRCRECGDFAALVSGLCGDCRVEAELKQEALR